MKLLSLINCVLIPISQAIHIWDYEDEVPSSTPSGFGRRIERSTFSDIFETLSTGTSLDIALAKALRVTPRSKIGQNKVRLSEPSPFTTPRSKVKHASVTPKSFSDIFQPRPPLVLKEHTNEQLKQLTTQRIDNGDDVSKSEISTLRAILDKVKKSKEIFEEDESQYDYEYVYDYVEVEENDREHKKFEIVTANPPKKKRPKIVPRQRIVPPKISKNENNIRKVSSLTKNQGSNKFSSFVTSQPINIGKPVTYYDKKEDRLDIINPTIIIQEPPSTRRIGYNYQDPDNRLELPTKKYQDQTTRIPGKLSNKFGSAYFDDSPDDPLSPSLQTYQNPPTSTPSSFSGIFEGIAYNDPSPEEPLTPSLQSVYNQPTNGYRDQEENFSDIFNGVSYNDGSPEEPLTPSLQSVYNQPTEVYRDQEETNFSDIFNGVAYNDGSPEEPLTPSLQSAYDPPTQAPNAISNNRKKFGYKYSSPDGSQLNYNQNQGPQEKFDTDYSAPTNQQPPTSYDAPRNQQPPSSYGAPTNQQPSSSYGAPTNQKPPSSYAAPTNQQPPSTYSAPKNEQPPSTYAPTIVTEQPPVVYQRPTTTTTKRTTTTRTTTIFVEKPPTTVTTYAPAFQEELPPYQPEPDLPGYNNDDLPSYNNDGNRYNNNNQGNEAIFVTPTPPPIIIPPKTMPGRRRTPPTSFVNPRSGQQKFAFSTLLPPINPPTTRPSIRNTETLSSFSDIFSSKGTNEKQKTSYKNNAPPPSFVPKDDSYGKPLGKPITTSNDDYEYNLSDTLRPPQENAFPSYDDYTYDNNDDDVTISGLDPRFNDVLSNVVSDNPSFDVIEKLQRSKDNSFNTESSIENNQKNVRITVVEDTTKLKGKLKSKPKTFSRFTDDGTISPPNESQFSAGYSGPVPETVPPTVFTDIIEPPATSSTSYEAPATSVPAYGSGARKPPSDSTYTVSVDPSVTNGHSGKIKIDINVNINEDKRGRSNSHGPVQTTYRTQETTKSYPNPTDSSYTEPTSNDGYSAPLDEGYTAPVTNDYFPPDDNYVNVEDESYDQNTSSKPYKKVKRPNYPRTYGSKVTDDRPNDFVAPDYNEDVYKDDFTAPDIAGEYETPSAPVVDDYYKPTEEYPQPYDDYTAPVVDDYYYGHEAPGYDNFEKDYYDEKPHHKHKKHKKIKPFVDFGKHPKPYKTKDFVMEPPPFYDDFHDEDPYFENDYEPLEKPFYNKPEKHYEPLYVPPKHYEPEPSYEPPKHYEPEPLYEPPKHYEESFYEPLEKPFHEEPYYEPEPQYEYPTQYEEPEYYHDSGDSVYLDPVPRGYYDKTTELIPELKDVIKPVDWDVHDFSSWRRLLDPSRFGGTLSKHRHKDYSKELRYEPPSYEDSPYEEPLYYEDYSEKPHNYVEYDDPYQYSVPDDPYEYSTPDEHQYFDYDTYDPPSYYEPPKKEIPKPFDLPFDAWLDSSGVGAFGLPTQTYQTYTNPPSQYKSYPDHSLPYNTYNNHPAPVHYSSNIGQRHHLNSYSYSQDEWLPSERPTYLKYQEKSQVELPFISGDLPHSKPSVKYPSQMKHVHAKLYSPPHLRTYKGSPHIEHRNFQTTTNKPGSIWTGLASFVNHLDPRNHYRNHPIGMVSMGSDNLDDPLMSAPSNDMFFMGSSTNAVLALPPMNFTPSAQNTTTINTAVITTADGGVISEEPELNNIDHDLEFSVSMSDDQKLSEKTADNIDDVIVIYNNQNSSKDKLRISPNFEKYLIDSSYLRSTMLEMTKLLKSYVKS